MAKKDNEKRSAFVFYVELGKTAKEIASLLHVSEQTVSRWVISEGWKEKRNAKAQGSGDNEENVRKVIDSIADERLLLSQAIEELSEAVKFDPTRRDELNTLRKQIAALDDASSKWNKVLLGFKKENTITLATYLKVMDQIFQAMRNFDEKLYLQTITFQEHHLNGVENG